MPRVGADATVIMDKVEVVDDLPTDEETSLVNHEFTLFAEFLAYVKEARISVAGELNITLAVPFEHKYDAMPLTDIRGIMFIMQCHRPMTQREIEWKEGQGQGKMEELEQGQG